MKKFFQVFLASVLGILLIMPATFVRASPAIDFEVNSTRTSSGALDTNWRGELFTANTTHTIWWVTVRLHRQNDSAGDASSGLGTLRLQINNVVGGVPNDNFTGYGEIAGDSVPQLSTGAYQEVAIALTQPATVYSGEQYAFVLNVENSTTNRRVIFGMSFADTYSGGSAVYNNGTWQVGGDFGNADWTFAIRGYPLGTALPATIVTTSAYSAVVNGVLTTTFVGDLTDNASNTTMKRGFQVGLSTSNYNVDLQESQIAIGGNYTDQQLLDNYGYVWRGEEGEFSIVSQKLSVNTTYYYRAYAVTTDVYLNQSYSYGVEKSFTTINFSGLLVPVVEISGLSISQGILLVGIDVLSSPSASLSTLGFRYGSNYSTSTIADNVTWFSTSTQTATHVGVYAMSTAYDPLGNIREGQVVFVQAIATDSLGNIGYSAIANIVKPFNNVGQGGLTVSITGIDVVGNTAQVHATIVNPAGISLTAYKVSWGLTSVANGQVVQLQLSTTPTTLTYTITNLSATTVYYAKVAIHDTADEWIWSQSMAFTTGSTIPLPVNGMPTVNTNPATGIGANHFTANGDLITLGDADVTELGFAWSYTNTSDLSSWNFTMTSGNFSTGLFSQVLSFSQTGQRIYYVAAANNVFGTSYGKTYYCDLAGGSSGGSGGSGTSGTGFAGIIDAIARTQQVDGIQGRWLVLSELLVLVSLMFVFIYVKSEEKTAKLIVLTIWAILTACLVGAFIFTGTLGIMPIVIMAGATVLVIFILGGRALAGDN